MRGVSYKYKEIIMKLYRIRHGESESNASDTHSGWSPVDLTPKGREQAL